MYRVLSLIRERYKLRVFENMALKGIFGPKKAVVRWKCRKVHNEELRNKTNKLRGLSPRENYTDRATAACRLS
jgi:hypothetical protein